MAAGQDAYNSPAHKPLCITPPPGGSWRQGKKHGAGTYYFGGGAKYQGEYKDGNPHGHAIFIEADGRAFEEEWELGKRTERKQVGKIDYTGPVGGASASPVTPAAAAAAAARPSAASSAAGGDLVLGDGLEDDLEQLSLGDEARAALGVTAGAAAPLAVEGASAPPAAAAPPSPPEPPPAPGLSATVVTGDENVLV